MTQPSTKRVVRRMKWLGTWHSASDMQTGNPINKHGYQSTANTFAQTVCQCIRRSRRSAQGKSVCAQANEYHQIYLSTNNAFDALDKHRPQCGTTLLSCGRHSRKLTNIIQEEFEYRHMFARTAHALYYRFFLSTFVVMYMSSNSD